MIDTVNKYYVGTLGEVQAIITSIDANSSLPNTKKTNTWTTPRETINSGQYAAEVPVNGWNGFTYEQMTAGITHQESQNVEFSDAESL